MISAIASSISLSIPEVPPATSRCDYDYTLITGFDVRFSAPVYPGETLTTDMWQDRNIVSFRCSVKARGSIVLNNGRCTLAP